MSRRGRAARRGQATLELLAAVPAVLLAGLLAWQLVAVLAAGMRAQEDARVAALARTGDPPGTAVVERTRPVPALLPGVGALRVRAVAAVRTP